MHQARFASSDGQQQRRGFITFAVFFTLAVLLIPVLVASIPPLVDYPNHLSRLWLLDGGASVQPVSSMYRITWGTLTNIGIDLIPIVLLKAFTYDVMGRLAVAAAVLLAPVGGVLLWRVLHGRFHWWQLSFGLLAWSLGLLLGFLNFEIGLGVALLAAAADPALTRWGPAISAVGRAFLGSILLLVHPFGFVFYAALLCAIAIGSSFRPLLHRSTLLRICKSVTVIAATLAVPALFFVLLTPSLPGKQVGVSARSVWSELQVGFMQILTAHKLDGIFVGIVAYSNWLDALTLAVLGLPVLMSLARRRLTVHAGMLIVVAGLLACYVICPAGLAGAYYVDSRFALMAPLALAVALRPEIPSWPVKVVAASLFATSLLRTSIIAGAWYDRQADVAALYRVLTPVPPGVAILPLEHDGKKPDGGPLGRFITTHGSSFAHLPTLALPWRHAFVPTVFASEGQQPVRVLPPWDEIAEPGGGFLPSVHALDRPDVYELAVEDAAYLKFWRERFDYAVVVNADVPDKNGPFVPPAGMELIRDEGFAQLFHINRAIPHATCCE